VRPEWNRRCQTATRLAIARGTARAHRHSRMTLGVVTSDQTSELGFASAGDSRSASLAPETPRPLPRRAVRGTDGLHVILIG